MTRNATITDHRPNHGTARKRQYSNSHRTTRTQSKTVSYLNNKKIMSPPGRVGRDIGSPLRPSVHPSQNRVRFIT